VSTISTTSTTFASTVVMVSDSSMYSSLMIFLHDSDLFSRRHNLSSTSITHRDDLTIDKSSNLESSHHYTTQGPSPCPPSTSSSILPARNLYCSISDLTMRFNSPANQTLFFYLLDFHQPEINHIQQYISLIVISL